ncbi:unnamed protein product [Trichobilharzia regenti]|nr:unnamed protein product [Trichobilharzia regenti]
MPQWYASKKTYVELYERKDINEVTEKLKGAIEKEKMLKRIQQLQDKGAYASQSSSNTEQSIRRTQSLDSILKSKDTFTHPRKVNKLRYINLCVCVCVCVLIYLLRRILYCVSVCVCVCVFVWAYVD